MKQFAVQDQKVTLDDEENQDTEGDQAPQGDPGQRDLLVNTDQQDLKDRWVKKGISEYRVTQVPRDLEVCRARKASKVNRESPLRLLLCCSDLLEQQLMKVKQPSWNV